MLRILSDYEDDHKEVEIHSRLTEKKYKNKYNPVDFTAMIGDIK